MWFSCLKVEQDYLCVFSGTLFFIHRASKFSGFGNISPLIHIDNLWSTWAPTFKKMWSHFLDPVFTKLCLCWKPRRLNYLSLHWTNDKAPYRPALGKGWYIWWMKCTGQNREEAGFNVVLCLLVPFFPLWLDYISDFVLDFPPCCGLWVEHWSAFLDTSPNSLQFSSVNIYWVNTKPMVWRIQQQEHDN